MDKPDAKDPFLFEEGELNPSTLHEMEVEDAKTRPKKGRKHKDRHRFRSNSIKKHDKKDVKKMKRKDTKRSKKESSSPSRSRSSSKSKLGRDHHQHHLHSVSSMESYSKYSSEKADFFLSSRIPETFTNASYGCASLPAISQYDASSCYSKDNVPLADPPLLKYQRKELLPEESVLLTKYGKSLQWDERDKDNYLNTWPESMRNLAEECAKDVSELPILNHYAFFAPDDDTMQKCHQSDASRMTKRTGRGGICKESFIRTHIKRYWTVPVMNIWRQKVEEIPRFLISTRSATFLEEDGCFIVKRINLSPSVFQLVYPQRGEKLYIEFANPKIAYIEVKTHCFHNNYTEEESGRHTTQETNKTKVTNVLDQIFKNLCTFQDFNKAYLGNDYDYNILLLFNGIDRQEVYQDIANYFQDPTKHQYKVYQDKFIAAWFEGDKAQFLDRLDAIHADLHNKRETTDTR